DATRADPRPRARRARSSPAFAPDPRGAVPHAGESDRDPSGRPLALPPLRGGRTAAGAPQPHPPLQGALLLGTRHGLVAPRRDLGGPPDDGLARGHARERPARAASARRCAAL